MVLLEILYDKCSGNHYLIWVEGTKLGHSDILLVCDTPSSLHVRIPNLIIQLKYYTVEEMLQNDFFLTEVKGQNQHHLHVLLVHKANYDDPTRNLLIPGKSRTITGARFSSHVHFVLSRHFYVQLVQSDVIIILK